RRCAKASVIVTQENQVTNIWSDDWFFQFKSGRDAIVLTHENTMLANNFLLIHKATTRALFHHQQLRQPTRQLWSWPFIDRSA
ncbi:MAG: hypothetical protein VX004_01115, partial [SAR324 cluster bacterium]|nr:hypothetical protein [SAR324 cluster bacterium]